MDKDRMKKSWEMYEVAKTLFPGGVQNARHPKNFTEAYPVFMERGNGSHVFDVDGHEYIDWMLSYGPIILGHRNETVDRAVREQIDRGFLFDLTHPLQLELGKKLVQHIPSAEKVAVVSTGSEATSAAVRIARIYTGREIVIRWGYHGWHDWSCPDPLAGIPKNTSEKVFTFDYNDLDSLQKPLEKYKGRVACIIMMPLEIEMPKPGFLEGVRELADQFKAVLVFDEVRSWPRVGLGGAQKHFGVTPDMTTLSKGIANGYPISAVVGRNDVMAAAEKTTISATYFPSSLGLSASLATIGVLEKKETMDHLWETGRELMKGLEQIVRGKKVEASLMGLPVMPFLVFGKEKDYLKVWYEDMYRRGDPGTARDRALMNAFYSETVRRGVFFHPRHHWFTCLAHTKEDVERTLKIAEESLDAALKRV
jgi:glutamate-1-semialdehyde aminotransferase